MSNKNKNLIVVYSLGILATLALGLTLIPSQADAADAPGRYRGYNTSSSNDGVVVANNSNTGNIVFYNGYNTSSSNDGVIAANNNGNSNSNTSNLTPVIYSLSPDAKESGSSSTTVSVIGANFNKESIVKWNGEDRNAIYISSTNLAVKLSKEDLSGSGEYLITVFNKAEGLYSNAVIFTLAGAGVLDASESTGSNLAGSAILAGGFMPFTLINWLILAIIILFLVILWRKLYINDKERNAPLKQA